MQTRFVSRDLGKWLLVSVEMGTSCTSCLFLKWIIQKQ